MCHWTSDILLIKRVSAIINEDILIPTKQQRGSN
jgi:hypothetical protein